jgi:hypothetical protein
LQYGCSTKLPARIRGLFRILRSTCKSEVFKGGPDETRTRDLRHAKAALSQLSYGPKKTSAILAVEARIARRKADG